MVDTSVDMEWPLKCDRRAAVLCLADDSCLKVVVEPRLGIKTHRNGTKTFNIKDNEVAIVKKQKDIYTKFITQDVPYKILPHDRFNEVNGAKVVAIRDIPKNLVLFELCGQLYAVSDHFIIPGVNDFSMVTSSINDKDYMFLGPIAFINHDCSPNVQWHSRSKSLSCVKTIRNIRKNDEILVFYGPHFFGKNNIRCKCETCEANCREFFSVKESVCMDLIRQDAVTQQTVIDLHVKAKSDDNNSDDDDDDSPSNLNTNTAVSMDLIQQDAVTQQTGIDLHVINKSDDNNSDDDDDDDSPSNLNTNTAVSMDLSRQDAVAQQTGIDLHVTNKSDDNNSDDDDDDDDDISDNAFQCDQCERSFKFQSWFKNHKTAYSVVGTHQCNYCPKTFKGKDNLKRHFLSHFGGVNYDCTQCGQPFNLKFNLSTHIKMKHAKIIKHKCSKCEMTFKDPRNKRYHENIKHDMVYPFVCPCGERFGAPNGLCRHRT